MNRCAEMNVQRIRVTVQSRFAPMEPYFKFAANTKKNTVPKMSCNNCEPVSTQTTHFFPLKLAFFATEDCNYNITQVGL